MEGHIMLTLIKAAVLFGAGLLLSELSGKFREDGGLIVRKTFRNMIMSSLDPEYLHRSFFAEWAAIIIGSFFIGFAARYPLYGTAFAAGSIINIARYFYVDYIQK